MLLVLSSDQASTIELIMICRRHQIQLHFQVNFSAEAACYNLDALFCIVLFTHSGVHVHAGQNAEQEAASWSTWHFRLVFHRLCSACVLAVPLLKQALDSMAVADPICLKLLCVGLRKITSACCLARLHDEVQGVRRGSDAIPWHGLIHPASSISSKHLRM